MKPIFLILSLLISLFNYSQKSDSIDLKSAIDFGLENHLNIKKTILELEKVKQQKRETQGIGLPQVNAEGSFNHFLNLPVQVLSASFFNPFAPEEEIIAFRAGTKFNTNAALQVNQLLFNGSYIVGLEFSKFLIEMQQDFIEQSKEEVVYQIKLAYHTAAITKENLTFLDSISKMTQETFEQQKKLLELGLISQEELDQLEFLFINAEKNYQSSIIQYKNSILALKISMQYPLDNNLDIIEGINELVKKNALPKGSLENNLNLRLLKNQEELSSYEIKNNKAAKYPSFSASFQQAYNAYRNDFDFFADKPWYPQTIWSLKMGIPIYSGGQKNAKIQQSKIKLLKNKNETELLEYNLKAQEILLKRDYQNSLLQLELQSKNIALAEKIYKNAIIKKEIGKGNNIAITQLYNQLIGAKAAHNIAYMDVLKTKLNIEKLYNQLYNPSK
tara:strand:- start:1676 stop:3010 length:1335 start_codon:yes stop_codon:yes gene_type:complete